MTELRQNLTEAKKDYLKAFVNKLELNVPFKPYQRDLIFADHFYINGHLISFEEIVYAVDEDFVDKVVIENFWEQLKNSNSINDLREYVYLHYKI